MSAPLVEVAGVIEAPVERVAGIVLDVRRSGLVPDGALTGVASGPVERYRLAGPGHGLTVEVDRVRNLLATQGGWWYRGEYRLLPHPDGTRLVHRVYNVARRMRWGVPLANRFFLGFHARTRAGVADLLARLSRELGCPARLE